MLPPQPLKRLPVHPLRLRAIVAIPAQPLTNFQGPAQQSVMHRLPLAGIDQIVTMATGINGTAIENPHTAATAGTQEPRPLPAKVTSCPVQKNGIFLVFPFTAARSGAVLEHNVVSFRPYADGGDRLPVSAPGQAG